MPGTARKKHRPRRIPNNGSHLQAPYTKADPKTGGRLRRKSRKWYIRYRDADGVLRTVPGYTDKEASRQLAAKLEKQSALESAGVVDRYATHRKTPLPLHLDDYRRYLEAKGNVNDHVALTYSRIRATLGGCRFSRISDLNPSRVASFLAELREGGKSISTSNGYLTAVKGFTRWMVRDGRMPDDPIIHLSRLNAQADIRRERRGLDDAEFPRLLRAAAQGSPFRSISGDDRAMLYLTAAYTGLRAGELASLEPGSFDFESEPATVTVEAGYSKRKRRDVLPLHAELAERLRLWIREKAVDVPIAGKVSKDGRRQTVAADGKLWPGTWHEKGARVLRRDLEAADIAFEDASGLVFDFHALRHQFISNLAKSGAHPKAAQALARHSTITLTMDRYTHLGLVDLSSALEGMPKLPGTEADREQARATGTDATDYTATRDTTRSKNLTPQLTTKIGFSCLSVAAIGRIDDAESGKGLSPQSGKRKGLGSDCQSLGSDCQKGERGELNPRPPDPQYDATLHGATETTRQHRKQGVSCIIASLV